MIKVVPEWNIRIVDGNGLEQNITISANNSLEVYQWLMKLKINNDISYITITRCKFL